MGLVEEEGELSDDGESRGYGMSHRNLPPPHEYTTHPMKSCSQRRRTTLSSCRQVLGHVICAHDDATSVRMRKDTAQVWKSAIGGFLLIVSPGFEC